jgi:hypothetical protein
MNQPPLGAASNKRDPQRKRPPIANAQNPNAESRGKGSSLAPSICGIIRMDTASKMGMPNRNIITEPWTVKIWL